MIYYLNMEAFFNQPDADLKIMLAVAVESPPSDVENQQQGLSAHNNLQTRHFQHVGNNELCLTDSNNSFAKIFDFNQPPYLINSKAPLD